MTITLPSALDSLVREKVSSGLYADETEVVCAALRHEFAQDELIQWVRAQAQAGFDQLDSGEFEDLDKAAFMARFSLPRTA